MEVIVSIDRRSVHADGRRRNGPEVYAVATKKDQSKIIWLESKRMVRKSPALSKRVRSLVAELDTDFNDGVFKPFSVRQRHAGWVKYTLCANG